MIDIEHCAAQNDTVWNVWWPDTPRGIVAVQKCPGGAKSVG